jgi:hypothetical protein
VIGYNNETYSVHFARLAGKLEAYLIKCGVACSDADRIIEESSVIYFNKLRSNSKNIFKFIKRSSPEKTFLDSACQAIEKYIPDAARTFGSYPEISKSLFNK